MSDLLRTKISVDQIMRCIPTKDNGGITATQIATRLGCSTSFMNNQLKLLKEGGKVDCSKVQRSNYYYKL